MSTEKNYLLKDYFKKILNNYCLENKNQITKFKFSQLMELPLVLSDRFWNIIISKEKNSNTFTKEEYSQEIEVLPKNLVINQLMEIYNSINDKNIDELIFDFLDIDSKGVLLKTEVKFLLRNIYVHENKTIDKFDEKIKKEITKIFTNSKVLLKNEYCFNFPDTLKKYLYDFFKKLKIFTNFNFIYIHCKLINISNVSFISLKNPNEINLAEEKNIMAEYKEVNSFVTNDETESFNEEDSYFYGSENKNNFNEISKERKKTYSFNNDYENNEKISDKKYKKTSFQEIKPDQFHFNYHDAQKCIENYMQYSCFSKNFFCYINQFYYIYRFFVYNGYVYYFKLSPKNNFFTFDGIILIHNTHIKKKYTPIEGMNPPLYRTSIISHVCFENLDTEIYSYNINDLEEFSQEIEKYSTYKKFKNNYKIIEEIGKGHFSHVYKIENILDNKIYAAKIIDKDEILDNNTNISMETWEKNIFDYIKNVPNANIVKSIEYFENSDNIYFIYEYLPDGTLDNLSSNIIKGIYNGLLYLSKNGIAHRDVKEKNIMLKNNIPYIIDFGLSKMLPKKNLMYESYGSLTYMAPEIFGEGGYDEKCDVWSFGIMLHYLTYNNMPFDSEDDDRDKIIAKIREEPYTKMNNGVIDNLIEVCLEKSHLERKSFRELLSLIQIIS